MTDQPTTDPTHGLSVQHADALWDAVAIPGPTEPTFPMQHERVCRAVAEILAELTPAPSAVPVSSPPPDQTAVLQRAADDLAEFIALHGPTSRTVAGWRGAVGFLRRLAAEAQQPDTETQACAHPDGCDGECPCPPSCGCCTVTAAPDTEMPNTDRAAVYREVADRLTIDAHGMQPDWARIYKRDAAVKVREWAEQLDGEGRQDGGETSRCCRKPAGAICIHEVTPPAPATTQPPAHTGRTADDCP